MCFLTDNFCKLNKYICKAPPYSYSNRIVQNNAQDQLAKYWEY